MYGLPDDFDPQPFVGRELAEVAFFTNIVNFRFVLNYVDSQADITVTTESAFVFRRNSGTEGLRYEVPVHSSEVMESIGKVVVSASGTRDGTLTLTFDNGMIIQFIDDQAPYESYVIRSTFGYGVVV